MIPNNYLIRTSLPSAGALLPSHYCAYGLDCIFRGGLDLNNGSDGIDFQDWKARISGGNQVIVEPQTSGASTTFNIGAGLTAASAAFDRGMNVNLAYTQGGRSFWQWFDTNANQYVTQEFVGARNILCVHDDVRDAAALSSDVIVTYQRGKGVFFCVERERYLIERTASPAAVGELVAFGMGSQWALLWRTEPL